MREIDKIHEKASIILVRMLTEIYQGNTAYMQEVITKAALRNPILFHDLFSESNQEEEKQEPLKDWRELASGSYFSQAVRAYRDQLCVDAWYAIQRVTEYCKHMDYYVPEMPSNFDWQHYAKNGKKINAIKEFRAIYQPMLPWIDLISAKKAIENFAENI